MKKLLLVIFFIVNEIAFASTSDIIKDCMDCHGDDGVSIESDIPTIAGASSAFIEASLFAYKDDVRPAIKSKYRQGDTDRAETDMKKIVNELNDNQITELSDYFSAKTFVAAKQKFDPALVKIGKKVHTRKCQKCHEDGGSSAEDDSGILAGQWTAYLQESMKHYRGGSREMDKKMKKKVAKLSDKEWLALLAFYASQQD
jgi:sulfide dehydrogenase cytochrome subunit